MMGIPSGELQEMCQDLEIDDDMMKDFIQKFMNEIELGLSNDHKRSSLKCFLTYVQDIPAGYEKGQYLSMNFSNQDVTVSLITLKNRSFDLQARHFTIPEELLKKTGEQIFDFLAQCIYDFTSDSNLNMAGLPMGVTFGFPCEQKSLKSAFLLEWTKDIGCSGAVGNDVVLMLEKSLSKRDDIDVKILAIINDTTETLLAAMWKVRKCKVAMVADYGCNISYVERIECIPKFKGDRSKPCMIINLESGNMGCNGTIDYLRTQWDRELDAKSQRPGRYLFEKMTGKEYLGELVRRIVLSAIDKRILFRGCASEDLYRPWSVDSSVLGEISKNWAGQAAARSLLRKLGIVAPTAQECVDFKFVCQRVWIRSAHLSAAAVAAVIQYMRCKQVGIGYSGGLLYDNPRFLDVLRTRLRQLLDPRIQFQFVNPDGVGGLGAALAACVANPGSIAMYTERLEEPEDVFYNDPHMSDDEKGRKSLTSKTLKGLSDTSIQLTPKKYSREHSADSILKKTSDAVKTSPRTPKRRSQSSLDATDSRSNIDLVKKPSVKSASSKYVSKELSESVGRLYSRTSKPQVRDFKPPAASSSSSNKQAARQVMESFSGGSMMAGKLQIRESKSPPAGTSSISKYVSKRGLESSRREGSVSSKSRIRDLNAHVNETPVATTPSRHSLKPLPRPNPHPKNMPRKDADTVSLHSVASQKSASPKEDLPHKVKSSRTNAAAPKVQPSPFASDRAVSNIGASGSRKKDHKEAGREGSTKSRRSVSSGKGTRGPEPRRSGMSHPNRKETHPSEKAKTSEKSSRGK